MVYVLNIQVTKEERRYKDNIMQKEIKDLKMKSKKRSLSREVGIEQARLGDKLSLECWEIMSLLTLKRKF